MEKGELLEMYKALIPIAKIDFDSQVEMGYLMKHSTKMSIFQDQNLT